MFSKLLLFFVTVFVITSPSYALDTPCSSDISLLPMYGGCKKTVELERADQAVIEGVRKEGFSLPSAAVNAAKKGFLAMYQGSDYATAVRRFNQAWLLDKNNGDAYYGFAMISWKRDKDLKAAEKFFRQALAMKNADNSSLVAYALFLFEQKRILETIPPLELLLQKHPTSDHANPMLAYAYSVKYGLRNQKACGYARAALKNGENLLGGSISDYCR